MIISEPRTFNPEPGTRITVETPARLARGGFDKEKRSAFRARLVKAGRIVNADGSPGPFTIPAGSIRRAVAAGQFNGLAVFADHPAWFEAPAVKHLIGVSHSAVYDEVEQAAVATLKLYDNNNNPLADALAQTIHMILDDRAAGIEPPDIGLSLVFWPVWLEEEGEGDGAAAERPRVLQSFKKIDSADLVFSPAADGRILEALSAYGLPVLTGGSSHLDKTAGPSQGDNKMMKESQSVIEVEAAGRQTSRPVQGSSEARPEARPESATRHSGEAWLSALRDSAAEVMIAHSELPAPIQDKLRRSSFATPDELASAISSERETLAALVEKEVIHLPGGPPRGQVTNMRTGLDRIERAVEALIAGGRPEGDIAPLTGIRELYIQLSGDYEFTGRFNAERVMLASVNSSTMAGLVANAMNKVLVNMFQQYPQWWAPIVTEEEFGSLQDVRWITLGGVGELPTVAEGAAYTELTWDDQTETDSFVKKGGYLGLTIEAIDKDDTRRLTAAPRALAQAAWLTLAKSVSAIFTGSSGVGPTMSDSIALFNASHSNLGTTALSFTAWEATRTAMRKQTDLHSGERLGALTAPKFLLVPPDLETTAVQVLASASEPGTANNDINPFAEGAARDTWLQRARDRVIVVDLWTDTNNWAAAADPRLYPSIGIGYRFGRTPEIFSVASPTAGLMFSNDTMPIKVRFFFAVGPTDWRGLYKHNVA